MNVLTLLEFPAEVAGAHQCGPCCDRTTHAALVAAPDDPASSSCLDLLAAAAGVTLAVIERPRRSSCGAWLVRWSRDQAPVRCGAVLVAWLRRLGRDEDAVHVAYRFGLVDDAAIERAWATGTDVLAVLA